MVAFSEAALTQQRIHMNLTVVAAITYIRKHHTRLIFREVFVANWHGCFFCLKWSELREIDSLGDSVENMVVDGEDVGGQLIFLFGGEKLGLEVDAVQAFLFPDATVEQVDKLLDG